MTMFGTAVILAGGKSSRMGFDKAFLQIGGKPVIQIIIEKLRTVFNDIVVVTNLPGKYRGLEARVAGDILVNSGPLGGIHSGLVTSGSRYAFFVACDMPLVSTDYALYMMEAAGRRMPDAVITRKGDWFEPFHSFYSKDLIRPIEKCVSRGAYKIMDTLKGRDVVCISEEEAREYSPGLNMFFNINDMNDAEKFSHMIRDEI